MTVVLMPLPDRDFDPTETGVPWRILSGRGHRVVFATPDGRPGTADPKMVTGEGLGILAPLLRANAVGRAAYEEMAQCSAFRRPLSYQDISTSDFDGLLLPGGHAKGMRIYLEAERVRAATAGFFAAGKPIGAICHGVLVAARSRGPAGKSVLFGKRTTGLTKAMELGAWALTAAYLGSYYRTYPTPVETEVKAALARPDDFLQGPISLTRDSPTTLMTGFTVRDGNYLSARWPGDAHRFATEFAILLEQSG
ncbi:MAG TPA: type 1 glutamine amidotransferase domain-containing protein [Stellaceae bacterium]|nr:type 1 glutamine amidotransferase domain-containing protein [Stellaceae bacterium]